MKIAAYCRVSTDKEDQLNSLEAQKKFFKEYTERTGDILVRLYADEGISGTKIKNRKEFLRMMEDAERGVFELVVVKDISRFARNTVDLLQNIRKLKSLGIETQFLTANMTNMGSSEFILTIFGALAQEESANTSKRVKFGKRLNAEKGRVPNLVFGYDKTRGELFRLTVNEREAEIVRRIFFWYCEEGCGTATIAARLNGGGIATKRNCKWSQNAVVRILTNEIYTGKVVNGKQEIGDFLTGKRIKRESSEWMVKILPELAIVDIDTFERAQRILKTRGQRFRTNRERHSCRYPFSTLIKCKCCGRSFRRVGTSSPKWVCSGRGHGCKMPTKVEESALFEALKGYFGELFRMRRNALSEANAALERRKSREEEGREERALRTELNRLERARKKYLDLYAGDLLSEEELSQKLEELKSRTKFLRAELEKCAPVPALKLKEEDLTDFSAWKNAALKRLVRRIEVAEDGCVSIFLFDSL